VPNERTTDGRGGRSDERRARLTAFVSRATERFGLRTRELLIFAAATLAAWAHTVDEIRIGEVIAVRSLLRTPSPSVFGRWACACAR
jgi:hypothetical protein